MESTPREEEDVEEAAPASTENVNADDDKKNEPSSSAAAEESKTPEEEDDEEEETEVQNISGKLSLAMVAKLKVKAHRWARPPVDNFEDMNLREFTRYAQKNPDIVKESVLGPTSMKHPTWKGSDEDPGAGKLSLYIIIGCFILALAVGLAVGLSLNTAGWGAGSGAIAYGGLLLVCFICLVTYMACYGNSLHNPPPPSCIAKCGFHTNIRANVICRYIMMCGYNGKVDIVDLIMNGEAENALKHIKELNDGQGPSPGGVCWLGDSEFTFWHNLSRDMSGFHHTHINAGFGGSRIKDIQANVNRLCLDWDPATVIIHASGNDYDFGPDTHAGEIPAALLQLFDTIAAHPSVERIGYMLSSRRPVYDDAKWDFMVRVHTLTIDAISKSAKLKNIVKILDLRSNCWPLDHFVAVDRVHLNATGHLKKSEILLPKMLAVWPPSDVENPQE